MRRRRHLRVVITPKPTWGNKNLALGWPWTLSRITDNHKRLYPSEVASLWGEATWTARDLWEVRYSK